MDLSIFTKGIFLRYWDWARPVVGTEGLPPVLYEDKVTITVAKGINVEARATVDNPLAFSPINPIPPDFTDEDNGEVYHPCY